MGDWLVFNKMMNQEKKVTICREKTGKDFAYRKVKMYQFSKGQEPTVFLVCKNMTF